MEPLQQARDRIDKIDAELARLFTDRMEAAEEIAALKQAKGLPIRDPKREAEVLARNLERIENSVLRPHYKAVLESMMACSRAYQAELLGRDPAALLSVHTAAGSYPIYLRRGTLHDAGKLLDLNRSVFMVTDDGIPEEYSRNLARQCKHVICCTIPQGETSKSPAQLHTLLQQMLDAGLTRSDCVLALGGGVVGDLAGLAAALYMRGIDFYNMPTTLLAMVDSSIGGKTAVDLCGVKNAIGAFWQPKAVLIDPAVLESLPERQMSNGLAEAVKMALTHDSAFFARFENPNGYGSVEDLIAACLRIKASVVEADEREAGLRQVLNFGHTLGHGLEAASNGKLLHGECVALGMLPMCATPLRPRLAAVLERLGLPTTIQPGMIDPERVLDVAAHDKKAQTNGEIRLVRVPEPGQYQFCTASPAALREALSSLLASAAPNRSIQTENSGRWDP